MRSAVKTEQDIQCLAAFVHGALAALHALGAGYNIKRRNWFDVAAHSAAMVYDVWATAKHLEAWESVAGRPLTVAIVAIKEASNP